MYITQELWSASDAPRSIAARGTCRTPSVVLCFGAPELLRDQHVWARLRERWPQATVVAGSTAGEICSTRVLDGTLVVNALEFERTAVRSAMIALRDVSSGQDAGARLAGQLRGDGLKHVFVLSDGLKVNGSELVAGLTGGLPAHVAVTGGLCGDGDRFQRTHVCLNAPSDTEQVVALGFYGSGLRVGLGSLGGWDSFGPERRVTASRGNVLFELDGRPALDLYREYLGEQAKDLPASGLLFPLTVRATQSATGVVRTILSINAAENSLTFAGDIPTGHYARLMRANFDRLLDGAAGAARTSCTTLAAGSAELAILISCVGRKLVLKQRVEEEVESVQQVLGDGPVLTGFYSYGEISPFTPSACCELHNQTMTITTLSES
jgi:hypothetical protein